MFGLGFGELIIIAIAALLVLKPEKLPEHVKTIGRFVGDLRRAGAEVKSALAAVDRERLPEAKAEYIPGADEPITSISVPRRLEDKRNDDAGGNA